MTQSFNSGIDRSQLLRFLGYRLTRTELHVYKLLGRSLAAFQLKPSEFAILTLLASNPGICLQQLGEAVDILPPNLVPVVERLVKRTLVLRRPDARDRRLQRLHLTLDGGFLQASAATEVERLESRLEQALSLEERRHLISALEAVSHFALGQGG